MGTYSLSKYVKARKPHECGGCGKAIAVGVRYLAYRPGLYTTIKICMDCSVRRSPHDDHLTFWCRAVEEEIAHRKQQADAQGPHDDERGVTPADEIGLVQGQQESQS